jgi:hypothetical protein
MFRIRTIWLIVCILLMLPVTVLGQDEIALNGTYTFEDGSFSFNYPEELQVREQDGFIQLASYDIFTLQAPEPGNISLTLSTHLTNGTLEDGTYTLPDVLDFFLVPELVAEEIYSEPIEFTSRDRPAVRVEANDARVSGIEAIILLNDDVFVFIRAIGAHGELEELRAITLAIAATINPIKPETPDLTETYTFGDGAYQLNYPEEWQIQEDENKTVHINNSGNFAPHMPEPGEILLFFDIHPTYGIIADGTFTLTEVLENYFLAPELVAADFYSLPIEFNVGEREAVRVESNLGFTGIELLILFNDDEMVYVRAMGAPDELEQLRAITLAVAETIIPVDGQVATEELLEITVDTTELTEAYVFSNHTYFFYYPEGWMVEESDVYEELVFVTNAESSDRSAWESGQAIMVISISPPDSNEGLPDDARPLDLMNLLLPVITTIQFEEPFELIIDGHLAARANVEGGEGMFLAIALDNDVFATINVITLPGDLDQIEAIVYALVSTIEYVE